MNDAEKKHLIIKLAHLMASRSLKPFEEQRYGKLGVRINQGAVSVRLYGSADGWSAFDTVYVTARDHVAEQNSLNREMQRMGIGMKGGRKIYSETNWNPQFADETLELLQLATVLDQLADL